MTSSIESLISNKLLSGYTLLSTNCPICNTSLVKPPPQINTAQASFNSEDGSSAIDVYERESRTLTSPYCCRCDAPVCLVSDEEYDRRTKGQDVDVDVDGDGDGDGDASVAEEEEEKKSGTPTRPCVGTAAAISVPVPSLPPKRQKRQDDTSRSLGQYLLQGWRMLEEGCGRCGTPICEKGERRVCVTCDNDKMEDESKVEDDHTAPRQRKSQPRASSQPRPSPLSVTSASATKLMGEKMLMGWTMMAETCVRDGCGNMPLMRPKGKAEVVCVVCGGDGSVVEEVLRGEVGISARDGNGIGNGNNNGIGNGNNNGIGNENQWSDFGKEVDEEEMLQAMKEIQSLRQASEQLADDAYSASSDAAVNLRRRRDANKIMTEKMLSGWAMLGESCETEGCYMPLLARGGVKECAACGTAEGREIAKEIVRGNVGGMNGMMMQFVDEPVNNFLSHGRDEASFVGGKLLEGYKLLDKLCRECGVGTLLQKGEDDIICGYCVCSTAAEMKDTVNDDGVDDDDDADDDYDDDDKQFFDDEEVIRSQLAMRAAKKMRVNAQPSAKEQSQSQSQSRQEDLVPSINTDSAVSNAIAVLLSKIERASNVLVNIVEIGGEEETKVVKSIEHAANAIEALRKC